MKSTLNKLTKNHEGHLHPFMESARRCENLVHFFVNMKLNSKFLSWPSEKRFFSDQFHDTDYWKNDLYDEKFYKWNKYFLVIFQEFSFKILSVKHVLKDNGSVNKRMS